MKFANMDLFQNVLLAYKILLTISFTVALAKIIFFKLKDAEIVSPNYLHFRKDRICSHF